MVLRAVFFLCFFFFVKSVKAVSYQWESKGEEIGFFVEIPPEYRWTYSLRRNGVIVTFTYESAAIEIRSFTDSAMAQSSFSDLINQKAARLAATYNGVRLLYEKPSVYRPDLYLASWEILHHGVRYVEQTALFKEKEKVIAISCVAPAKSLSRYQVAFENAIFSLLPVVRGVVVPQFLRSRAIKLSSPAEMEIKPPKRKPEAESETKKEEVIKKEEVKKEEQKEEKLEEKKAPPQKEDKKTADIDSFLPPLK